jgi:hypothetical protein
LEGYSATHPEIWKFRRMGKPSLAIQTQPEWRRAMKLLTEEIKRQLKPLYACEKEKDPVAVVKFFCPWNQWTWFAWEACWQTEDGRELPLTENPAGGRDALFFGAVRGDAFELGYFSLRELETVRGPAGLRIERDLHFRPTPLSKIREQYGG